MHARVALGDGIPSAENNILLQNFVINWNFYQSCMSWAPRLPISVTELSATGMYVKYYLGYL